MATRADLVDWLLVDWLYDALRHFDGRTRIVAVCGYVWEQHEEELRDSDDLFFTWQYDIRWAATRLRQRNIMRQADESRRGVWELR